MKFSDILSRFNLKFVLLTYVLISLIYTASKFYNLTDASQTRAARRSVIEPSMMDSIHNRDTFFVAPISQSNIEKDEEDELRKSLFRDYQLALAETTPDPVFQSKLFDGAMGPSDLKPFYFRASQQFPSEDITISTIVTSDRFPVLSRLASRYKGPISAAIHINDDENKEQELRLLHQAFNDNPDMRRYVDVHLIVDPYDRQFNMWRNTAKLYARTEYIMMLDIDFYLCTNFRQNILQNPSIMSLLREGHTALVVPAFEYLDQLDGAEYSTFPETKDELMRQVFEDERIDMFHVSWQKGHSATNYMKWYTANEPYKVEDYNFSYEPYVIFKKQGSPWCDERFIGYGANKAACLYEIYLSGIDYYVLPDDFLIHQSHAYPESTRKKERLFNRKVYSNFREELCLRYSRQFVANSQWDSPRSENLRNECQKIRGFNNILENIDK
ncbi:hypothetical protein MFLAVUS_002786 [Mucor flavus]|uniref:Glycosyltransferase family 49 protein n=1 Tax=Mucor flavus TaxID=439312 RepID=A0ABP9YR84_9FUNG